MQPRIGITCLAAAVLSCSTAANAAVLYSQAPDGSGDASSSQNDTTGGNGNFATVYDSFTLASNSTITGVEFTGAFFNPPEVGNITGFTIGFYSDNAGQPGGSLLSSFTAGNGSQTCVGTICTYNVAGNFAASGGTSYWMSIVPDLGFPPQWGWAHGTGGDGAAYQDFFGVRSALATDMAFTLTGTAAAVPEPATWAMLILGFGMVGGTMRSVRRRQRTSLRYA